MLEHVYKWLPVMIIYFTNNTFELCWWDNGCTAFKRMYILYDIFYDNNLFFLQISGRFLTVPLHSIPTYGN